MSDENNENNDGEKDWSEYLPDGYEFDKDGKAQKKSSKFDDYGLGTLIAGGTLYVLLVLAVAFGIMMYSSVATWLLMGWFVPWITVSYWQAFGLTTLVGTLTAQYGLKRDPKKTLMNYIMAPPSAIMFGYLAYLFM